MDSSVSLTHGDREGSARNGHFDCSCYHPNFLFNQFGMLERCALRHGNVHSADGWRDVLDPVIALRGARPLWQVLPPMLPTRSPAIHERLEEARFFYAIRLPANAVLGRQDRASANAPCRAAVTDQGQAVLRGIRVSGGVLDKERWVIAKIEWHPANCSRVSASSSPTCRWSRTGWCGSLQNPARHRRAAHQRGQYAFRWTRLSPEVP